MLLVRAIRNTAPVATAENNPSASSPHTTQVTLMWPTEKAAAAPGPRTKKMEVINLSLQRVDVASKQKPYACTCLGWPPQLQPIMMNHFHLALGINHQP